MDYLSLNFAIPEPPYQIVLICCNNRIKLIFCEGKWKSKIKLFNKPEIFTYFNTFQFNFNNRNLFYQVLDLAA